MSQNAAYAYRAARSDGLQEIGVVEASTREAASTILAQRGLFPIEIRLEAMTEDRRGRVPVRDLALGLRMLATLLDSGLPMSRALTALDELAPSSWGAGLPSIRESVRQGNSLAAALLESSLDVSPIVIGIIRAGEAGSGVAPAVRRAAELTESSAAIRSAVRNALAYPLLLAGAGLASVTLLVWVVLPRFGAILADLGQSLPATTRLVLTAAEAARAGAMPAFVGIGLSAVAWRTWTARETGLRRWHELLLALPVIGNVRRSAAAARACAALAALLESGVPIAVGLLHASRTMGDAALSARLLMARETVIEGHGIARSLEAHEALTPTAVRLVRTGEETGRLEEMFEHAARLEQERTEQAVRGAVRLLEPTLILIFAAIVALLAASLLQAVYSVRPTP